MEKWEIVLHELMRILELVSLIAGVFSLFYKTSIKLGLGLVSLSYMLGKLIEFDFAGYYCQVYLWWNRQLRKLNNV